MFSQQPLLCTVLLYATALLLANPCSTQPTGPKGVTIGQTGVSGATGGTGATGPKLTLKQEVPPSHDWDTEIAQEADADIVSILQVLKKYNIPGATIGIQMNPKNESTRSVPYFAPPARGLYHWWMASYGIDYRSPMRVASVSKPMAVAVWMNYCSMSGCLRSRLNDNFYDLWTANLGPLPTPKDPRVLQIKIKHLLVHTSGFDNDKIGFDPAFQGTSVTSQIAGILSTKELLDDPGMTRSYSNFGFMILARLAQGLMGRSWISMTKSLFPNSATVPVFGASDNFAVSDVIPGAAEPGTYYVQEPDGLFKASTMAGNGNIVSNVATLSWFATKYWIGGDDQGLTGKKMLATGFKPGYLWTMNGDFPGTMAVLSQYTTPANRVAAICVIVNTRVPEFKAYLTEMNSATETLLQNKFNTY